jgi:hypothetical protein
MILPDEALSEDFLSKANSIYKSVRPFFWLERNPLTTDSNGEQSFSNAELHIFFFQCLKMNINGYFNIETTFLHASSELNEHLILFFLIFLCIFGRLATSIPYAYFDVGTFSCSILKTKSQKNIY